MNYLQILHSNVKMRAQDMSVKCNSTYFTTNKGIHLAADMWGSDKLQPVMFLHGGGQNRSSWGEAARVIASEGFYAITVDLRGHGESDYAPDGDYHIDNFVDDIDAVILDLPAPPVLIGASLGGIIALIAAGERKTPVKSIVLVDVAFRVTNQGASRILTFMRRYANGFESLEKATEAISLFLPHRKNTTDKAGQGENLNKYLRKKNDGRYYWHWDPQFLETLKVEEIANAQRLINAARHINVPLLLLRGMLSDIVTEEIARELLEAVPRAKRVDIPGAAHTVPGDSNSQFINAILTFLKSN